MRCASLVLSAFAVLSAAAPAVAQVPSGAAATWPAALQSGAVWAREADGRVVVRATRVTEPPRLDGRLDDETYREVPAITEMIQATPVSGAPGTDPIDNAGLLSLEVDLLVLAALEGQVTAANADTIRARVLAEGANGPVTPDADPILAERGVVSVPDILCNAGGVIVSYFEWVQNLQSFAWPADQVAERLRTVIDRAPRSTSLIRRLTASISRKPDPYIRIPTSRALPRRPAITRSTSPRVNTTGSRTGRLALSIPSSHGNG